MKKLFMIMAMTLAVFAASASDKPEYPGGQKALDAFLADNVRYPAAAMENGIEGVVGVDFTVNADGSIGSIKIVRLVDPDLEQEAIRVVKSMPAWIPADNGGTPVAAPAHVDIRFILQDV